MLSSIIVSLVALICLILFILYKRNILSQVLPDNTATLTSQLKLQLEQTADTVIEQLEERIGHLESLLYEADAKIIELEKRLKAVDTSISINPPREKVLDKYITSQEINTEQNQQISSIKIDMNSNIDQDSVEDTITVDDDKRRLVLAMAEQGYNITEIAKVTGKGKGEIMLLLQLNKR